MIIERNKYEKKKLKALVRIRPQLYLFSFDPKEEHDIVCCVSRYTRFFVIINTYQDAWIEAKSVQCLACSSVDIEDIMEAICYSRPINNQSVFYGMKEYMLLIMADNTQQRDALLDNYFYSYICNIIKNYRPYDFYFLQGHAVVKYKLNNSFLSPTVSPRFYPPYTGKTIILLPFAGLGDHFMQFSIIYQYIINQTKNGNTVLFARFGNDIPDKTDPIRQFHSYVNIAYFNSGRQYLDCMSLSDDKEFISLFDLFFQQTRPGMPYNDHGYHVTEVVKAILNVDRQLDPYLHNALIQREIEKALSAEEKNYIDYIMKEREYVGFQYFTGNYDEKEDAWTTIGCKNWSEKNVSEFVDLCRREDIPLLTLCNSPYNQVKDKRLRKLSLSGYAYAISKLKMVVGIDSSAGHIAAFYNIPSITLWGGQTPFEAWEAKISFRPLRNNTSIYSSNKDINLISPKTVFKNMKAVLNHMAVHETDNTFFYDTGQIIRID